MDDELLKTIAEFLLDAMSPKGADLNINLNININPNMFTGTKIIYAADILNLLKNSMEIEPMREVRPPDQMISPQEIEEKTEDAIQESDCVPGELPNDDTQTSNFSTRRVLKKYKLNNDGTKIECPRCNPIL
jgi:hypothetical protein